MPFLRRVKRCFCFGSARQTPTKITSKPPSALVQIPSPATFLGCPPEIRNMIYKIVLAQRTLVYVDKPKSSFGEEITGLDRFEEENPHIIRPTFAEATPTKWETSLTPLHLVCTQISEEVKNLLTDNVTFAFDGFHNGFQTILDLGVNVKHVAIVYESRKAAKYTPEAVQTIIKRLPNLKSITLIARLSLDMVKLYPHSSDVTPFIKLSELSHLESATFYARIIERDGILNQDGPFHNGPPVLNWGMGFMILGNCTKCARDLAVKKWKETGPKRIGGGSSWKDEDIFGEDRDVLGEFVKLFLEEFRLPGHLCVKGCVNEEN